MDIFIMSLLPYYLFLILKVRYGLYMLQQNSYNTENRYLKWTIKNYKKVFLNSKELVYVLDYQIKQHLVRYQYVICREDKVR